jgi:peptide/nickel transport system substrate-binding protein
MSVRLIGALLLAITITGCSTGGGGVAPPSSSAVSSAGTGGPTAAPKRGGTLIVTISGDPDYLNPNLSSSSDPGWAVSGIYSGLVQLNERIEPEPDLADRWTISPDAKRYEFHIRNNARFHDGSPVTSADVKYTVEEVAGKYLSTFIAQAGNIASTETPDAQTVVFNLKAPSAIFIQVLTLGAVYILPKKYYEGTDLKTNPRNSNPIGSGPFKFKEWVKGDHITLVRNDDYYISGQPYLDQYIARIIPDNTSRVAAFQKGDIDYIGAVYVPRDQIPVLAQVPGVQINKNAGQPGNQLLMFNMKKKPWDDVRVRTAISHAIDRQQIVQKAYAGIAANVAKSAIMAELVNFHDPNTKLPEYDLNKAKALLDEAGLKPGPDGVRLRAEIAYINNLEADRLTATVIRDMLKDVGVQLELKPYETATIGKPVYMDHNFDLHNVGLTSRGDPSIGLERLYTTAGIGIAFGNGPQYNSPENDRLWQEAGSTADTAKRREAFFKVQALLAKDLPALPLVDRQQWEFSRSGFGGIFKSPYLYYRPNLAFKSS